MKYAIEASNPTKFKIVQRIQMIAYRIQRLNPPIEQPPPPRLVNAPICPIHIRYGHPVATKKLKKSYPKAESKKEVQQDAEKLRSFHQRVVVVKGRLKKPITNQTRKFYLPNFHTMTL